MKTSDMKTDLLLKLLRKQTPELEDAESLKQKILEKIQPKISKTKFLMVVLIRSILSAAAIALIAFYCIQQKEVSEIKVYLNADIQYASKINIDPSCTQNRHEQPENLMKTYSCYLQKNSIKNKQSRLFNFQPN